MISPPLRIVVATFNSDKFESVRDLLSHFGYSSGNIVWAGDICPNCQFDTERGDIMQRAESKALRLWKLIKEQSNKDIDAVLGVDDGIIAEDGQIEPELKKYISLGRIGPGCNSSDIITLVRAHAFVGTTERVLSCFITQVPYRVLKNNNSPNRRRGNVLNHYLAPLTQDKTLAQLDPADILEYKLFYVEKVARSALDSLEKELLLLNTGKP